MGVVFATTAESKLDIHDVIYVNRADQIGGEANDMLHTLANIDGASLIRIKDMDGCDVFVAFSGDEPTAKDVDDFLNR